MKNARSTTISFKVRTGDKRSIMKFVRKWMVNKGYTLYDKEKRNKAK